MNTQPEEDWEDEYGPGGANQEWFERYISGVEREGQQ